MEQHQQERPKRIYIGPAYPRGQKPELREGLCNKNAKQSPCCRPVKPGKKLCQHHWEQNRRLVQARKQRTLSSGLCTNCHKRKPEHGYMNCQHCRDSRNAGYRAMSIAERRALREKYKGKYVASPRDVSRENYNQKLLRSARDEQSRTGEPLSVILKRMGAPGRTVERWESRERREALRNVIVVVPPPETLPASEAAMIRSACLTVSPVSTASTSSRIAPAILAVESASPVTTI